MKKYFALLIVMTAVLVGLAEAGIGGLPFEKSWSASGGDAEFAWTQTYRFVGGHYTLTGYPPLSESGTYSVVAKNGDGYVVLMKKSDGSSSLMELTVEADGSLDMRGYSASGGTTFK